MNTIDVHQFKSRIESGEALHVVDVREPSEHDEFNVGGILIPLGDIRVGDIEPIESLKDQEVIL